MKRVNGMFLGLMLLYATAGMAQTPQAGSPAPPSPLGGPQKTHGTIEVLSDAQGVDFGPYLSKVVASVRMNWYSLIPEVARPPLLKTGKVAVEFAIMPDGHVSHMMLYRPSGDVQLDRAAWGAITASAPFAHLPGEFHGPYLALRMRFYYNPTKSDMQPDSAKPGGEPDNPEPK